MARRGPTAKTAAALEKVLGLLAEGSTMQNACAQAGISVSVADYHARHNPDFRQRLEATGWTGKHHTRDTSWRPAYLDAIKSGMSMGQAAEAVKVSEVWVWKHRRDDPDFAGKVVRAQALARRRKRRPPKEESRWRRGARDEAARRAHNAEVQDLRRSYVLAQFRPVEDRLLVAIATGTPLREAAERYGLNVVAVQQRAQWDDTWRVRLDAALTQGRDPNISHGTSHSYKAHKCRCPDCRHANDRHRGRQTQN